MTDPFYRQPRRHWFWRRGSDYGKAALIAVVTVAATNLSQCAWNDAASAAKEKFWRHYSAGTTATIAELRASARGR